MRYLLILLILTGCDSPVDKALKLKAPIILSAKGIDGVLLKGSDSTYYFVSTGWSLAETIYQSYKVGDTIK